MLSQHFCIRNFKIADKLFKHSNITSQFNKASNIDRKETLIFKEKSNKECLVFSTTFNKNLPNIRQWKLAPTLNQSSYIKSLQRETSRSAQKKW